ncbi:type II toxin-antitoxin system HicA family toxin [Methylomonas sp. UP202]|uniref:type II toxin-antitoxin system HicA family toxin n=1 Tax=Methylomonas sp. UP202 TaxID=3040943 RepID=UPI00247A2E48|nr:type II toxin-antitoxin system HicA family toxin [Methylomonas sp. UP202]WGS85746.1 type II toxin-antitoxin system HicA family toxin [Methylomonas sp. UP202]
MSKKQKLIEKFKSDSEFTWQELERMMLLLGFEKQEGDGSRVKFYKPELTVSIHKPHPDKSIKHYVRKEILARLKDELL